MDAQPPPTAQSTGIKPVNDMQNSDRSPGTSHKTLSPLATGTRSFAERKARLPRSVSPSIVRGDQHTMRDIGRPPPGDVSTKAKRSQSRPELNKQRSNYFEDAFCANETNPAKDRVLSEAMVVADVKTNVIIRDEFTFITELSYLLSTRYQRPISSVAITLQHGTCMVFGSTFDPAYVLSVFALPTQLQPTTNKRNAALIQKHMEEAIGVKPSRGFLRFVPTPEEHTARNGKTLAGEIDDLEKSSGAIAAGDPNGVTRSSSKPKSRLGRKSFGTFRSSPSVMTAAPELRPPTSAREGVTVARSASPLPADLPGPALKTAKRSKSFMASFFGLS